MKISTPRPRCIPRRRPPRPRPHPKTESGAKARPQAPRPHGPPPLPARAPLPHQLEKCLKGCRDGQVESLLPSGEQRALNPSAALSISRRSGGLTRPPCSALVRVRKAVPRTRWPPRSRPRARRSRSRSEKRHAHARRSHRCCCCPRRRRRRRWRRRWPPLRGP